MFGKITDRLMPAKKHDKKGNTDSIVQDALLAQVLAINFHELIDLKPLMIDLDNKLNQAIEKRAHTRSTTLEDVKAAKKNLHSAARHIRDKQIAALTGPDTGTNIIQYLVELITGPDTDAGTLQYISVVNEGGDPNNHQCRVKQSEVKNEDTSNIPVPSPRLNGCLNEPMQIVTPKKDKSMLITINNADWENERFTVRLNVQKIPKGIIRPSNQPTASSKKGNAVNCNSRPKTSEKSTAPLTTDLTSFELSWFDFPFTDNTLLADGSRYAFFIDKVCKNPETDAKNKGKPIAVRLGILFFPKDYYPSRERPVSYRQLNEKLGLSTK